MTSAQFSWLPQDPRWDLQGIVEYSVQMRPVWCCILCPILCNACSLLGASQSQQQFPLISYWPTSTRVLQRNTSCGVAEWPKYAQGEQAAAEPGQLAWPRVRWGWSRWRWCYRPWATTEVLKTSTLRSKKIIEDERWLVGLWFAKVMEQKMFHDSVSAIQENLPWETKREIGLHAHDRGHLPRSEGWNMERHDYTTPQPWSCRPWSLKWKKNEKIYEGKIFCTCS